MAFSFDEFFDPLIRDQAAEFEDDVPFLLRGAYRKLVDLIVGISLDDAAKRIVERILDGFFKTDGNQPLVGFALSNLSASEAEEVEAAVGIDPLTVIALIAYAVQVIEWFRKRRQPVAYVGVASGLVIENPMACAMLLTPDLTLTVGERLRLSAPNEEPA